jgi:hypothetical protein
MKKCVRAIIQALWVGLENYGHYSAHVVYWDAYDYK